MDARTARVISELKRQEGDVSDITFGVIHSSKKVLGKIVFSKEIIVNFIRQNGFVGTRKLSELEV